MAGNRILFSYTGGVKIFWKVIQGWAQRMDGGDRPSDYLWWFMGLQKVQTEKGAI